MTSGNGFGVNEEHVAASFWFIVKPSSAKTRLSSKYKDYLGAIHLSIHKTAECRALFLLGAGWGRMST